MSAKCDFMLTSVGLICGLGKRLFELCGGSMCRLIWGSGDGGADGAIDLVSIRLPYSRPFLPYFT